MKSKFRSKILLAFSSILIVTTSCKSQVEKQYSSNKIENTVSDKKDYELANEFLLKLKKDQADTIIYYKRTCINCCDFYNIFWSTKGQRNLTKFYFDFEDMKTHSKTIVLKNDSIFEILGSYYIELKNTSVKENTHKLEDGTSSGSFIDHYCYAKMNIYIAHDSIITDRMKDHDFDQFTDLGYNLPYEKDQRETNDNYTENINSKWNLLLISIESQISTMPETTTRELERLRTRKSNK